jgi:hypothetical protein
LTALSGLLYYILWIAGLLGRSRILGFAVAETSQHIRNHVHFFEVHQVAKVRLVAFVSEGQVFEKEWNKRNNRGMHFRDKHSIGAVVA